jgi:hypothetical protein
LIPLTHISPPSTKPRRRRLPGAEESDDEREGNQDDEDYISANDGVDAVRNGTFNTHAPSEVEQIVWDRIAGYVGFRSSLAAYPHVFISYPTALKDHIHTTNAYLPIDVAKALAHNPALVQRAVETFYTRDAIQLRVCRLFCRVSALLTEIE